MSQISAEQIRRHSSPSDAWLVVEGGVYDVTSYLDSHPDGKAMLLKDAGKDATIAFKAAHTTSALSQLPQHAYKVLEAQQRQSEKVASARRRLPRLKDITNLDDMEIAALTVLPPLASAFYARGSDTEASLQANRLAFSRYYFNPRVLRRVDTVDTSVTLLGKQYPLPIMGSAVGNTHMAGPDCDWHLTKGLAQCKLPHMRDHATSTKLVRKAVKEGAHAVFVTVDVAQIGNQAAVVDKDGLEENGISARGSAATSTAGMDRDLNWNDLAWINEAAGGKPVILKGIQSLQDVFLAVEAGVQGIVLSNHGGRQLDYTLPPMDLLYDLRQRHPHVLDRIDVFIDGGIRHGTDILKALCLSAKAVSLGRPLVFAEAAYRHLGVVKTIRILEEEILTGMRLLGASGIVDLKPEMVERVDFYGPTIASHVAAKHLSGRL
ncbi:related to CYB2-L-lactate dehydrogenase (cytochrome b2) [Ustilago bromivora]|uniref:Related to CYB2-L-lactate dehydrogenase (Cytochrome b2) n=1 Tax=Ustilago bromivora TaxID=307758 RepID=A0A1K0FZU5_9BASI|nr:related to CYB2-L-lactate dehydrogenase (cytochrome b2) [Ustilago bromivora]